MERNLRKTRIGKVVSDKMDKTIVVAVENHVKHPLYGKINEKVETDTAIIVHALLIIVQTANYLGKVKMKNHEEIE